MIQKTKAELEKEVEAKGQMLMDKNNEIRLSQEKIQKLEHDLELERGNNHRGQKRMEFFERDKDGIFSIFSTLILARIVNGEASSESKIEVLKDLLNESQDPNGYPRERYSREYPGVFG